MQLALGKIAQRLRAIPVAASKSLRTESALGLCAGASELLVQAGVFREPLGWEDEDGGSGEADDVQGGCSRDAEIVVGPGNQRIQQERERVHVHRGQTRGPRAPPNHHHNLVAVHPGAVLPGKGRRLVASFSGAHPSGAKSRRRKATTAQ